MAGPAFAKLKPDTYLETKAAIAKLPPQNIEAEQSLLGALLIDKDAIVEIAETLRPEHFYKTEQHGSIYSAILELFEKREPIDLVTVTERLKQKGILDIVGGPAYLTELVNMVPTAAHIMSYCRIIKEHATRRTLISQSTKFIEKAYDESVEIQDIIEDSEQAIFAISQQHIKRDFIQLKDALAESFDRLEEIRKSSGKLRGVPTGFKDLDSKLAGLQDSNLIIFAARPGMGKCLAYDSKIVHPQTGQILTIEEYFNQKVSPILTLEQDLTIGQTNVSRFVDDGIRQVYRVVTDSGREIEVTASHPFLTIEGWKHLYEIDRGEKIGLPRQIPVFGVTRLELRQIFDLADSVAGSKNKKLPGAKLVNFYEKQNQSGRFLFGGGEDLEQINQVNDYVLARTDLDIQRMNEKNEQIETMPEIVYTLNRDNLALFLKRFFTQRAKFKLSPQGGIEVDSSSKFFLFSLCHLLLRFGINCRITPTKSRAISLSNSHRYSLRITEVEDLILFAKLIGTQTNKKELELLYRSALKKIDQGNFARDTLSSKVIEIVKKEKERLFYQLSSGQKKKFLRLFKQLEQVSGDPTRKTILQLGLALNSVKILQLVVGDVCWDKVTEIELVGLKQVYDVTIPDTHNFIANDIFVHNTSFALNIAAHAAVQNSLPVAIFSLEMSQEELVDRLLVGQADIDSWRLKTGRLEEKDDYKLGDAMGILAEAPIYIDDTPGASLSEIRTKARRLQAENGLKLIIVDYLQLIHGNRKIDNRVQEVSEISQGLKNLARELKVPVFALSQLSRAVEQRGGVKKPQLADLRESGAIEQDADVVMFIYREDEEKREQMKLDIQKHRNGPTGEVDLIFKGDRLKFYGMEKFRNRLTPKDKESDQKNTSA